MILHAQVHPRPYLIQWDRMLRWRDRAAASIANDDEPFDFLAVLFANIFQMRDWLLASRPDLAVDTRGLFAGSKDLGLARDVANGSKHMALTSASVEGAACIAREYAGGGTFRYVIPIAGGANVEALPLADSCIGQIRTFMTNQGLLP